MQISDLIGQYHQNRSEPKEVIKGVKGVENLVSTLLGMKRGNVFEGTINEVKGNRVTLGLSNGQAIHARLDGKLSFRPGDSMFFQVKSNEGGVIEIKPFMVDGETANLTLLNALKAAGLPTDGKNLTMVNSMMQENMSIDAESLGRMAREGIKYPEADITTLVQMKKLQLPLSGSNISQFENYQNDVASIGRELTQLAAHLSKTLSSPHEQGQGNKLLFDLTNWIKGELLSEKPVEASHITNSSAAEEGHTAGVFNAASETEQLLSQEADGKTLMQESENMEAKGSMTENAFMTEKASMTENASMTEKASETENQPLSQQKQQLLQLKELFGKNPSEAFQSLSKIIQGKEAGTVLTEILQNKWSLTPEELQEPDAVKKMYEKMDRDLAKLEQVLGQSTQGKTSLLGTVQEIRGHISFMNDVNQLYTYVQLPLQMSSQNTTADLYVYTNKKSLREGNGELSAFLHLDMEHLGPCDVSVKMFQKKVSTNFYFDDEDSFQLVEGFLPRLEQKLKDKGYDAKLTVVHEEKTVDFVEDFLKKDSPSAGSLRRYSFDIRA